MTKTKTSSNRRRSRRDRVDVVADILSFVKEHPIVLFNHIRFGCLVSNTRYMRWYLQQLLESGCLETHLNNRCFSITDKGRRFLSLYELVNEEMAV